MVMTVVGYLLIGIVSGLVFETERSRDRLGRWVAITSFRRRDGSFLICAKKSRLDYLFHLPPERVVTPAIPLPAQFDKNSSGSARPLLRRIQVEANSSLAKLKPKRAVR